MGNDSQLLPLALLPVAVVNVLREAASQSMGLWDYIVNGGFITVVVVLWVALRR